MTDESRPTASSIIHETPWYGFLLIGAAFLAGALLVAVLFTLGSRSHRNSTAVVALCALRGDLDARIKSSREFLHDHPHGVDGITPVLIRQSLANSVRTRKALDILDC